MAADKDTSPKPRDTSWLLYIAAPLVLIMILVTASNEVGTHTTPTPTAVVEPTATPTIDVSEYLFCTVIEFTDDYLLVRCDKEEP
jgi:hypothetical protein